MYPSLFQLLVGSLVAATSVNAAAPYSPRKPRNDVLDCLTSKNVPFVVKSDGNWTSYATPYNLRLVYEPAVITVPETPEQVASSVTCAAAASLKVQAKGGGHSYASYSSGGKDGSLIVDMEKFASIDVDKSTFIAKIGAGQRLGNIAIEIFDQAQRGLPHGTCSGVGIAGHALHGGYGYASRKWGITLDTIVGIDVVLANGSQIYTSCESYPDVFYAMKGAGDAFAIATYFYLQTQPAPASVTYFSADLAASLTNVETVTAGFEKLQNFVLTSPLLTPNITLGMYTDTSGLFSISGWCMDCDTAAFTNSVFPAMLAGFPGAASPTVTQQGWIEALTVLADPYPLAQPLGHEYTSHDTFYAKSIVSKNARPLTTAAIRAFWAYMVDNQGKGPFYSIINLYGGPGSAINAPSPDSSAYSERDTLWVFQNYESTAAQQPPYDPAAIGFVDGLNAAVENAQPDGDFSGYINYVDSDLDAMTAAEQYYGAATYNKLLDIKMQVDPTFVFWNPQAVGNSMALPV
ncbi:glucooligosaccharide oxidase [Drepanopeziza brunnea f. sp. 'multigermtubi' MB_m1]|uniref:Glucooligosaccharide oxidase n=1 Tax=Marssonina brunnea f. sp. multigermtubi (strain MB_m1) TaxID=1072389 RepID=K1WS66_MARBU|nr:glucooligosaccharide oxidase [Drepanopeziza brunnea f. sp. 'multigermtubi' MB_m1]EKD20480.1 glucooligosaccharide oxidase [Drepanopeziza brunnea f. sp. 'multigermtubi' MB_m1]